MIAFADVPLKSTNALFMDQVTFDSTVKASTWWDGSKLSFTNSSGFDCNEIFASVKNVGERNMGSDSKYYVYYFSGKAPYLLKNGSHVFDKGVIKSMTTNAEPQKLTYKPTMEGAYLFVAFQHPEMPDDLSNGTKIEERNVIVSNPIIIKKNCKENDDDNDNKTKIQSTSEGQSTQKNLNEENETKSASGTTTDESKNDTVKNPIQQSETDNTKENPILNFIRKFSQMSQENSQTKP